MLLEHKQHVQSYNALSSKQRKIFAFKEIVFKDYNKWLLDTIQAFMYNLHKPRPWEHTVHVEKRKSCCSQAHLWVSSNCRQHLSFHMQ